MPAAGWKKTAWAAAMLLGFVQGPVSPARAQGTATETVGFSIQVEPVFVVESTSDQGGNLEFQMKPGETVSRSARVSVRSNAGRPYRILQRLEQPLMSGSSGDAAEQPVLFVVTDGVRGGRSEVKSPQPLTTQPTVVFESGREGESDDFTITYSVSPKHLVPAGSYQARILIEEEFR